MENNRHKNNEFEKSEMNKDIVRFCCGILTQFQDVLTDREKEVCNDLLEGHSKKWISDKFQVSEESIRKTFHNSIKKISAVCIDVVQKKEMVEHENMELKHKLFVLEKDMAEANAEARCLAREKSLSENAVRILETDVRLLPLSKRAIYALQFADVETFKDIPLLPPARLYKSRNCGTKTINEIKAYLDRFNLEIGMVYDDIVSSLLEIPDEVLSSERVSPKDERS